MDFRFSDEQEALRDALRSLLGNEGGWDALTDMGVFSFLVPGQPGGAVEAAIAFEELGLHLFPGPVLWSAACAPLVPGIVTGATRVTGAVASGRPLFEHVAESDGVVVLLHDTVEYCPSADLPVGTEGEPFDPMTPMTAYQQYPRGSVIGAAEEADALRRAGAVLASAYLVGNAQRALDVASAYALERHQFGVPIGSFQAIKHMLADMYVRTQLARSATYAAAAILNDERGGDLSKVASTAKVLAGEAGIMNGKAAVQVLGGMGFTWEMLPHYCLKRAWVYDNAFGAGETHALALSDGVAAELTWT
jgi:alkylation response protein AidB-like acyl-CoA dehydrogenase